MATAGGRYVGAVRRAGSWLAAAFDERGHERTAVFEDVGSLWACYEERADRILIDVPIGLLEDGEQPRRCETLARSVLGDRGEAVPLTPVREATRKHNARAAKRVNQRKAGWALSERAFARCGAVAAVDDLLGEITEARSVFAESHPELCFRAFAGEPLAHSPSVAAGYAERMRALAEFDHDAPPTVQAVAEATGGHALPVAAVLAAVALGYTARPGPGALRTLPADPPTDPTGLPMAMAYRAATPLSGEPPDPDPDADGDGPP